MAPTVSPAVLRTVPLFSSFPEEQLRTLATVVSRRSASRGSIVIAAGDPTDSLYIILSGRLKVMMSDAEGKEVILSILSGGEFFGEMGLIDDAPRSASVVAIEPRATSFGKRLVVKVTPSPTTTSPSWMTATTYCCGATVTSSSSILEVRSCGSGECAITSTAKVLIQGTGATATRSPSTSKTTWCT